MPTASDVLQLPVVHEHEVPAEHVDENGHMNIRYYLDAAAGGVWQRCNDLGIDDAYRAAGHSFFTVEHHIRYVSEMREGTRYTTHARFLGASERAVHAMGFVVDRTHDRLAATLEVVFVHVAFASRRVEPMAPELSAVFAGQAAEGSALAWDAPVCGAMGLRR